MHIIVYNKGSYVFLIGKSRMAEYLKGERMRTSERILQEVKKAVIGKDELLEKFAVVKCPRGGQNALAAAHILGVQESRFDTQVLVDNAPEVRRANPGAVLEPACIDDIMTFFAKGGERE